MVKKISISLLASALLLSGFLALAQPAFAQGQTPQQTDQNQIQQTTPPTATDQNTPIETTTPQTGSSATSQIILWVVVAVIVIVVIVALVSIASRGGGT